MKQRNRPNSKSPTQDLKSESQAGAGTASTKGIKPRKALGHKASSRQVLKRDPNVCWCNMVPKSQIEQAIREGKTDIYEIFDATTAGVGACGGSCRPHIQKMIDQFLRDGTFPKKPR